MILLRRLLQFQLAAGCYSFLYLLSLSGGADGFHLLGSADQRRARLIRPMSHQQQSSSSLSKSRRQHRPTLIALQSHRRGSSSNGGSSHHHFGGATNMTLPLDEIEYFYNQHEEYKFDENLFKKELDKQLSDLQSLTLIPPPRDEKKSESSDSSLSSLIRETPTIATSKSVSGTTTSAAAVSAVSTATTASQEDGSDGMLSELWKARSLLIGAAALYGTNFSLVKLLGDTMPVGVSTTLRFGLAALSTMPWLLKDLNSKDSWIAAGLGFEVGLWTSIGYVAQAVGLETTPASESAFICSLAVVTVPLMDCIAGKKLESKQWVGALLAVFGVAFLELGDVITGITSTTAAAGDVASSSGMTTGDILSLIQPFAFGLGFWRMEHAMSKFPNEAPRMTAGQLLAVFISSLAYGFWAIDASTLQSFPWTQWLTSPETLFSLFWTGVVTTALTIYMETLAMKTLSAAETTLIFSTEPLWGTAFAAIVMGEQLGMNVAIGATFILTACLYSNLGKEGIINLFGAKAKANDINNEASSMKNNNIDMVHTDTTTTTTTGMRRLRSDVDVVRELPATLQRQWIWFTSGMTANWLTWSKIATDPQTLEDLQDVIDDCLNDFLVLIQNNSSSMNYNPNDAIIMLEQFIKHNVA